MPAARELRLGVPLPGLAICLVQWSEVVGLCGGIVTGGVIAADDASNLGTSENP